MTLDPSLVAWIQEHAGPGKPFSSISHGLERGIVFLQGESRVAQLEVELARLRVDLERMTKERDAALAWAKRRDATRLRGG